MKKLLLSVVFAIVALTTTFATQLNPFAYNLYVTEENGQPKLHFFLNADADRVRVILSDGVQDYVLRDYPTSQSELPYVPFHPQGYATTLTADDVASLNLPADKDISWRVEVTGGGQTKDVEYCGHIVNDIAAFSIDIDNNPKSPQFGRVLITQACNRKNGVFVDMQGVYAYTPGWGKDKARERYTGGVSYSQDHWYQKNHATPYKVRVAQDGSGRFFISNYDISQSTYLWVADDPNQPNVWIPLLTRANAKDMVGGTYNIYNFGLDVKTNGNKYELLLLSTYTSNGADGANMVNGTTFCGKYTINDITNHTYVKSNYTAITKGTDVNNVLGSAINSTAQFDEFTGVWYYGNSSAGSEGQGTKSALCHVYGSSVLSYGANDTYLQKKYATAGGVRYNSDLNKLIVSQGYNREGAVVARMYDVTQNTANSHPTLSNPVDLSVDAKTGEWYIVDFAWDYAKNIYMCVRNVDTHTEIQGVHAFATGVDAKIVTTECQSVFNIPCQANTYFDVEVECDEVIGMVTGAGQYLCGSRATVTAVSKTSDYRFKRWSNGVTESTYEFTVSSNLKLTAEFEQINPIPCVVAYDLKCQSNYEQKGYTFSFYVNTKPTYGTIVFYDETKTEIGKYVISQDLNKGNNSVEVPLSMIPNSGSGSDILWEVELIAPDNTIFGKIFEESSARKLAYAVIDNNPQSDFFGRIYIENSDARNDGYYCVLDYKYQELRKLSGNGYFLGYAGRPAIDSEGYVYWAEWLNNCKGLYVMNPSDYSISDFFLGSLNSSSVCVNNGNEVGSTINAAHICGEGANSKLIVLNEKKGTSLVQNGLLEYNIGQLDGSIKRTWGTAPSKKISISGNASNYYAVVGTSHGTWVASYRSKGNDAEGATALMFYDNAGTKNYSSHENTASGNIIDGSYTGLAMTKDEKMLALAGTDSHIWLFDVTWSANTPILTHKNTFNSGFLSVPSMHFDYAGNLITTAGTYLNQSGDNIPNHNNRLVVYTLPKSPNKITVPARYSQRIPGLIVDEREEVKPITEEATYKTAMVNRPLVAGMYNTLCLPFNLASLTGTPYENAKVLKFTGTSTEEDNTLLLHFQEVSSIEAGVPYLIQTNVELGNEVVFNNVFCPIISDKNPSGGISHTPENCNVTFHAVMSPIVLADYTNTWFLVANNRLAVPTESGAMYGLRGYFTFNGPQNMPEKASITVAKPTPTGDQYQVVNIPVITPSVRKIMRDGQIYILRGDEVYTITGNRVK